MRIFTLLTISALSIAAATPALAMPEGHMMKDGMHAKPAMHMSAAQMRQMRACKAMSHRRMMRNARCARMMGMHPDMMSHGNRMHGAEMMKHN